MKRLKFILLFLVLLSEYSVGQSMEEVFKSIPINYTPELSSGGKDSLIHFGVYTIPGGDTLSTMEIAVTESKPDFIQFNLYFSTGQKMFSITEIRTFKKKDGSTIVVFAKSGGLQRAFDQYSLLTFEYSDGDVVLSRELGLPETIAWNEFLKSNLPDSLKLQEMTLSTSYDLYPQTSNAIAYLLNPQTQQFNDWIGEVEFLYVWNGNKFERKVR
ncbi:hypothetical protein [Algoriphagus terrigena]|uniref:hypothetical protein n=1 Tax=Algoriphagus terrigena TaxID=344884 RepID=UPI000478F083|nr:hypothetical protein [Algoriphagus terrigena]